MDLSVHLNKHRGWMLTYGIILIILGLIAISLAAFTTLVSIVFLGVLLLIGGIFTLLDSFKFWRSRISTLFLHLIVAILFIAAGLMLIKNPAAGALSVTLLLAIFYLAVGVFRILAALALKVPYWGWRLFSGVVALALGVIILAYLPTASLLMIGLFIGIDLLFCGWAYVILALAGKNRVRGY